MGEYPATSTLHSLKQQQTPQLKPSSRWRNGITHSKSWNKSQPELPEPRLLFRNGEKLRPSKIGKTDLWPPKGKKWKKDNYHHWSLWKYKSPCSDWSRHTKDSREEASITSATVSPTVRQEENKNIPTTKGKALGPAEMDHWGKHSPLSVKTRVQIQSTHVIVCLYS